ncbi:unnamed protein product [Ectocarpus sp. CCAP 1310/34]|nr:unnamed protein product [Ectocarpus sp. CCAP 1310/34]
MVLPCWWLRAAVEAIISTPPGTPPPNWFATSKMLAIPPLYWRQKLPLMMRRNTPPTAIGRFFSPSAERLALVWRFQKKSGSSSP